MKFTLGQAAKETGVAKSTLSRAIDSGKLSATRDGKDAPYEIDPAELFRVYPRAPTATPATGSATDESNSTQPPDATHATLENASDRKALQREIELLREMLEGKNEEVHDLRRRLDIEGEERRKLTMMLTHQPEKPASGAGEAAQRARRGWWPFGRTNS